MKLNKKINNVIVESDNGGTTGNFGMVVDAKSFGIIVDGIYSNTIEAIVREYSCNAVDSHKYAGHLKKFDLHLPTEKNPIFYIRDYGVGLDEEDIVNVFTVAFKSTKDNSNLTTGQLGIGAMCAFAYNTKSFTVTAWKNGIKYIYNCFINEEGCPAYIKLDESKSDEPTGVLIEIACAKKDIHEFKQAACNILQWFDIIPNIINNTVTIPNRDRDIIHKTNEFGIYHNGTINECKILMGNVLYSIPDISSIRNKFCDLNFFNENIVLFANIDDIDFAVSREFAKLTPKTVNFILNSFKNIRDSLQENINNLIQSAETPWGKLNALKSSILYKNQSLRKLIGGDKFINDIDVGGMRIIDYVKSIRDIINNDKLIRIFKPYPTVKGYKEPLISSTDSSILLSLNFALIKNDKSGCIGAIGKYVKDNKTSCFIMYNSFDIEQNFKCSKDEIILASSLPKPVGRGYNGPRVKSTDISIWVESNYITNSWIPTNEVFDDKKKYYYIPRSHHNFIDGFGNHRSPTRFKSIALAAAEMKIDRIYGVKEKYIKKLGKNWVNIIDHMKSIFSTDKFMKEYNDYHMRDQLNNTAYLVNKQYYSELEFINRNKNLIKNNELIEWEQLISQYIIEPKASYKYHAADIITQTKNKLDFKCPKFKELENKFYTIQKYKLLSAALKYNKNLMKNEQIDVATILTTL